MTTLPLSRDLPPVRYVAEPTHVREVSLRGSADLVFWTRRLEKENLRPSERNGRAQLLIVAAEMKFMGVQFTEVSFSLAVRPPGTGNETMEAAFLVHAFNSCRFFAFCERRLFATPYSHADCRVSVAPPARITVTCAGVTAFRAEMGPSSSTKPSPGGAESRWEGPIFLPARQGRPQEDGRMFFGRMRGLTSVHRFIEGEDIATLSPGIAEDNFRLLLDSEFTAEEWLVRPDATHGKSKTYRRRDYF